MQTPTLHFPNFQKRIKYKFIVIWLLFFILFLPCKIFAQNIWVSAYYAAWQQGYQNTGYLPSNQIDYSAVTHIIHFSAFPGPQGQLDLVNNGLDDPGGAAVLAVADAHAAGKKILFTVGGWGADFNGAIGNTYRTTFISNLVNFMMVKNYDGIDLDMEPIPSASDFQTFVPQLRSAMSTAKPGSLLTIALVSEDDSTVFPVQQNFDQINIMTYDMSGAFGNWPTWHNSPIFNGGLEFPCCPGSYLPSANEQVDHAIAAGLLPNKLGIGIDFYGYVWNGGTGTTTGGATEPLQSFTIDPTVTENVAYYDIMANYYQPQYRKWDIAAEAAYLSIDMTGSANDTFISYDDQMTCTKKIDYVRNKGIGGVIIWELAGGYRKTLPIGQRDSLLQAVKVAAFGSAAINNKTIVNTNISVFPNPSLGSITLAIEQPLSENIVIRITNVIGQEIYNETLKQFSGTYTKTLDLKSQLKGIYFIGLFDGKEFYNKKIILQ